MSPRLGGLLLLLLTGLRLAAQLPGIPPKDSPAAPRISLPQLRVPATRLEALRQYLRQSASSADRQQAKWLGQDTEISVVELSSGGGPPRYLVNWRDLPYEWRSSGTEGIGLSRDATGSSYFLIFDATGVAGEAEPQLARGLLNDWRGEGVPEELVPEMAQWGSELVSWLRLTAVDPYGPTLLLIEYDRFPIGRLPAEPWGGRVVREQAGEVPEIQLGPWRERGGPEAKVCVKWDRARRAWTMSGDGSGKKVRMWTGAEAVAIESAWKDHERIWKGAAAAVETTGEPRARSRSAESQAPLAEAAVRQRAAPPYARRALAGISDSELLEWMSQGRSFEDSIEELVRARWAAWRSLDPAAAALASVREHLPPASLGHAQLVFASDAPPAPEEGDLVYSDAPSGCFAPAGGYRSYLHCAREGSFLAIACYAAPPMHGPLSSGDEWYHFARQPLAWAEARQMWQTAWWLAQVRVRCLTPNAGSEFGGAGGSTGDGFATVSLRVGHETRTIEAMRFDTNMGAMPPVALSELSGGYDRASFVTLTGMLFRHWFPATDLYRRPHPPTAEEARAERAAARALLPMTRRQPLLADLEETILEAAGDLGWREFAPALKALRRRLPPPTAPERELDRLDREIAAWERRYGKPEPSGSIPGLPGMESLDPAPPKPPLTAAEAWFAPWHALYQKRDEARARVTPAQDTVDYRRVLAEAGLRQLTIFDDEERLARRARQGRCASGFAIHRLAQLNAPRAVALLREFGAKATTQERLEYDDMRRGIEPLPTGAAGRKWALAILRNGLAQTEDAARALFVLAPVDRSSLPADLETRKAVQATLDCSVAEPGKERPVRLALTAARVLGGSAWESLRHWVPEKGADEWSVAEALPALTLLAQREPEKFRRSLVEVIRQRLLEPGVEMTTVCRMIWQADLRELAPELEKLATGGPRDVESPSRANGPGEPVTEPRSHRARQVLSLWQEDDAGTRARLLVAMGAADAPSLAEWGNGSGEVWKAQLLAAVNGLPTEERARLRAFARWCERQEGVDAGSFRTLGAALPKGVL